METAAKKQALPWATSRRWACVASDLRRLKTLDPKAVDLIRERFDSTCRPFLIDAGGRYAFWRRWRLAGQPHEKKARVEMGVVSLTTVSCSRRLHYFSGFGEGKSTKISLSLAVPRDQGPRIACR